MAKKADLIKKAKEMGTKFIQKGEWDKALEQYRQLAKLEPNDLRHRMKIGELLSKLGKKKDAVAEYNAIVEQYTKDGFLIQAIAVCKLIIQLDPNETAAQNKIADLNSRRGIVSGKPQAMRPALSLAGVKGPIASAVQQAAQEAAAGPEDEPALAEPEASDEPALVEDNAQEPIQDLEEEAAPDLVEPEDTATESEPIPLDEAAADAPEIEEPQVEEGGTPFPPTPLFTGLTVDEFKTIVEKFQIGTLPKGMTVIKEGSQGDAFFIMASGKVRVYKMSANGKRKMTLATLESGSFFGEFAFLTNSARTASIETLEECVLLRINRADLQTIIKKYPHVQTVMNEFYTKRVLETLLAISPLFENLSDSDRREVISRFDTIEADTGDVIITEGEPGRALYLIKYGSIDVTVKQPNTGNSIKVATLGAGDFFGEISILQNKPTTATCTASGATGLFRLDKMKFNELAMVHPQILETISASAEERMRSTAKSLTAKLQDRQEQGLV